MRADWTDADSKRITVRDRGACWLNEEQGHSSDLQRGKTGGTSGLPGVCTR